MTVLNPAEFYFTREASLSSQQRTAQRRGGLPTTTVWEPELDGRGGNGGKAARMGRYVVEEKEEKEEEVTILLPEEEEEKKKTYHSKEGDCWWMWILVAVLLGSVSVLLFSKKPRQYRLL